MFKNLILLEEFFFENLIIHKPFLGSREVPTKFWPNRLNRFKNKQTNTQTSKVYTKYIDSLTC